MSSFVNIIVKNFFICYQIITGVEKGNFMSKIIKYGLCILIMTNTAFAVSSKDENLFKGTACPLSEILEAEEKGPTYDVLSPTGESAVMQIEQAPRLSTLNGKTIAVVGTNFNANVTHAEIKRLILKNYPDAKVILQDEIGSAGLYPPLGTVRRAKDEFQRKLKEMKVDAVISGNGGCGICTPKEEGSCIAAEYIGIPCVMIAGPGFVEQAKLTALNSGVPVQRVAEYPGAFALHSEEELVKNTQEVLWPQIVEGLTKPIIPEERTVGAKDGKKDIRDIAFSGTYEEIQAYFKEMKWSDGLPIVPPTAQKVNEFLKYTPHNWDETIAVLPISNREIKTWHVAVNAVMSGSKPEYMPILIAMTKGFEAHKFNWTLGSTHAWTPFSWLNGPVVRQLGIDAGQGEINEPANAVIGRFMNLAMLNFYGYYVKQTRMGTFGYMMPWCMAEDDEANLRVGWQPFHVRAGYNINDSTITLSSALLWGNNMTPATTDAQKVTELMAWDITERGQFALGSGKQSVNRTVLMTEAVAITLSEKYKTIDELEAKLIELARRPAKERAFARYYANPGSSKDGGEHSIREYTGYIRKTEEAANTPTSPWYASSDAETSTIPVMQKDMTAFLITGDSARNKIQIMPGEGTATVKIDLPDNWNELMQDLGYEPLSKFYLKSTTPMYASDTNHAMQQNSSQSSKTIVQGYKPKRPSKEQYQNMRQQRQGNFGSDGKRQSKEQYQKMMRNRKK